MIEVGVVGASGYGGGELLRILQRHPQARLACAVSETYAGEPLSASFPGMAGTTDLRFVSDRDANIVAQCEVVFLAQENGHAMKAAPRLLESGVRVVDLSADFRFRDTSIYEEWYKTPHCAVSHNANAVYGLPELNRATIRNTKLVGNPGCYATTSILAMAPLVKLGLIDTSTIVIDGKSGVSGAGRSRFALDYHFPEINESVSAYKIAGTHRHTPEIEQALGDLVDDACLRVSFTPHLIPMTRGILATCYARLMVPTDLDSLLRVYSEFYTDAPFVAVIADRLPASKHTLGTNYCHIGLAVDARTQRVTVIAAIDNLIKGAAGQAIQNMNLMCGLAETTGLEAGGIWP